MGPAMRRVAISGRGGHLLSNPLPPALSGPSMRAQLPGLGLLGWGLLWQSFWEKEGEGGRMGQEQEPDTQAASPHGSGSRGGSRVAPSVHLGPSKVPGKGSAASGMRRPPAGDGEPGLGRRAGEEKAEVWGGIRGPAGPEELGQTASQRSQSGVLLDAQPWTRRRLRLGAGPGPRCGRAGSPRREALGSRKKVPGKSLGKRQHEAFRGGGAGLRRGSRPGGCLADGEEGLAPAECGGGPAQALVPRGGQGGRDPWPCLGARAQPGPAAASPPSDPLSLTPCGPPLTREGPPAPSPRGQAVMPGGDRGGVQTRATQGRRPHHQRSFVGTPVQATPSPGLPSPPVVAGLPAAPEAVPKEDPWTAGHKQPQMRPRGG